MFVLETIKCNLNSSKLFHWHASIYMRNLLLSFSLSQSAFPEQPEMIRGTRSLRFRRLSWIFQNCRKFLRTPQNLCVPNDIGNIRTASNPIHSTEDDVEPFRQTQHKWHAVLKPSFALSWRAITTLKTHRCPCQAKEALVTDCIAVASWESLCLWEHLSLENFLQVFDVINCSIEEFSRSISKPVASVLR